MPDRRRTLALACLAAMVAALVGAIALPISDSGGTSYDGLATRYQAVTARLQADTDALRNPAEPTGDTTLREAMGVYLGLLAATERAVDGYRGLEVPDDMAAQQDDLVDALGQRVAVLELLIEAIETGDSATANGLVTALKATAQPVQLAQRAMAQAISECGEACI